MRRRSEEPPMDEAVWLAGEDPEAMLEHVRDKVGERKLRLWVEAGRCAQCESAWSGIGWSWAAKAAYHATASCSTPARKAALLREVVGNPFRPTVVLPRDVGAVLGGLKAGTPTYRQENVILEEVLTWHDGLVPRLARAAYDERSRECKVCRGNKVVPAYAPYRLTECSCGGKLQERWDIGNLRDGHPPKWCPRCWAAFLPDHVGVRPCNDCKGSGVVDDGTLDSSRLLVLADALEEAGCAEEALLRHLRGEECCPKCRGTRTYRPPDPDDWKRVPCSHCRRTGWIALRGPHVPGCWALDLLLGLDG